MKHLFLISILSTLSLSAFAQIPQELQDLLPAGKSSVRLMGQAKDGKKCSVNLSLRSNSFNAAVAVLDDNGEVNSRRFGKFQVGFGYELKSVSAQNDLTIAKAVHNPYESYGSSERFTLKVNKTEDRYRAVQIIVEEKGFFGFSTKVKETCAVEE